MPAFYGEKFSRVGVDWPDVRPPRTSITQNFDEKDSDKSYLAQLDQFESAGGPYANELSEPLMGLGKYHAARGEYKQAVRVYRRALHIVRLNDGLYSELQAPIVRELLNTVRLSGDLSGLDDRYDYFFRLYGGGKPPYTDIRMRAAQEYLRWQREALRLGVDDSDQRRLLNLIELNESLLESAPARIAFSLEYQWALTLGQMRNLYLLQSRVSPPIEKTSLVRSVSIHSSPDQSAELDFTQRQLENLRRNSFRMGRQILDQYITATELSGVGSEVTAENFKRKARAILELADWCQWNGSYSRSAQYYSDVIQMLGDAGEDELLEAWFGTPVELPDNGAFWQPFTGGKERTPIVVDAIYDVSAKGRAHNITVEVAKPEDESKVYRFKRELAGTRFRPRYEQGKPVATAQLSREYEYYR